MIRFAVTNRFTGDVQFTAEIDADEGSMTSIKLRLAVLQAFKTGADLAGANLVEANLAGANLDGRPIATLCARATRGDGYEFFMWLFQNGSHMIRAGCRTFTTDEFRAHVAESYPDTPKARETLAIVAFLETRLVDVKASQPINDDNERKIQ